MQNNSVQKNIPDGWHAIPVASIFTFVRSYSFSRANLVNGILNSDRVGNIHYGDIHSTFTSSSINLQEISVPIVKDATFLPNMKDFLKEGDLIMADASEDYEGVGVTVSIHGLEGRRVVGGLHTFVLRDVSSRTNKYFRQYIFRNPILRNSLQKIANGVSVYGISKKAVSKLTLPIPPLAEQNRIVAVLDTWDKAIEKLSLVIEKKKNIKIALASQFVYSRKDVKEHCINDLFKLGRGRVISKGEIAKNAGEYPVYSSQTSNNGIFGYIDTYDFDGEYLTWTTDGANAGRVFYRKGKFNCTNVCGIAELKTGLKVNSYFVYVYLNYITKKYVSYVGNPKLMNGVFASIQINLPSIEEQNIISDILNTADKEIQTLERKLKTLQEQKHYLLNNLITGTIRTPETLKINVKI